MLIDSFVQAFSAMQAVAHEGARSRGWHDTPMDDGTRIALMHSELSEALEGLRAGDPPSDKIPEYTQAEEELADVIIRIMDMAGMKGWRIAEAVAAKMEFNARRTYRHGGKLF
jgi:NTP pyrophosphatase (non-canonical NTP hydrolase)